MHDGDRNLSLTRSAAAKQRSGVTNWRERLQGLKEETYALYLAAKDPRVPWYGRVWIAVVVAYAFSPIDLIPDFIPVLGYLDDLVLVPLGVLLAIRLIPGPVLAECRLRAKEELLEERPHGGKTAVVIALIWLAAAALVLSFVAGLVLRL